MAEEWRLDMENRAINMQEKWIKLEQYKIPKEEYVVTTFLQNSEGTKIVLHGEKTTVELFFDGIPVLLRNTIANARMRTWSEVQLKYRNKAIFRNAFLFEVKSSKLIQWFIEESCKFYDDSQLRHYCVITTEEIIDILATFEPNVKIINAEDKS